MATKQTNFDKQPVPNEEPVDVTIALAELGEEIDHLVTVNNSTIAESQSSNAENVDSNGLENDVESISPTAQETELTGGNQKVSESEITSSPVATATSGLVISTPASRQAEQQAAGQTRGTVQKGALGSSDMKNGGRKKLSLPVVLVLILALVVGSFGLGYWFGQRAGQQDMAAMGMGENQAQQEARIKELQASVKKDPKQVKTRLELGLLLFNSGKVKEAKTQWLEVVKLDEKNIEAWYNLGFCYLSEEPADKEAARKAWDKVVEIDPKSSLAQTVQSHMDMLMADSSNASPETTAVPPAASDPEKTSGAKTTPEGK